MITVDPDTERFAKLQAALDGGTLSVRANEPRSRRLLPNATTESSIPPAERVRLGARDECVPELQRSRPRA